MSSHMGSSRVEEDRGVSKEETASAEEASERGDGDGCGSRGRGKHRERVQAVKPRGVCRRPPSVEHQGEQMDEEEYKWHVKAESARRTRESRVRQGGLALVQREEGKGNVAQSSSSKLEEHTRDAVVIAKVLALLEP